MYVYINPVTPNDRRAIGGNPRRSDCVAEEVVVQLDLDRVPGYVFHFPSQFYQSYLCLGSMLVLRLVFSKCSNESSCSRNQMLIKVSNKNTTYVKNAKCYKIQRQQLSIYKISVILREQ